MNYEKIAKEVIANAGGQSNIDSVTHCATRLRIIVRDKSLIDEKKIEEIDGVKGTFYNSGQFQIIFGTGIVERVYAAVSSTGIKQASSEDIDKVKNSEKNSLQKAVRTLGDVFVPLIPVLVATGLFLGLRGALLNNHFLELFGLSSESIPHSILILSDVLTGTTFAFIPALVCWSAFRVFGGTPIIGLVLGLMLVSPALPNAYVVADPTSGVNPIPLFAGIGIVGYQGSILPAFATGFLGSKLEKKLREIMPTTLDFIVTPFLVLLTMMLIALVVIGPILNAFEHVLMSAMEAVMFLPFGLGGLIIGTLWSVIVLTGVHHVFNMLEISLLTTTGFNPFNAIVTMGGFANAGVCLAIALKARKKSVRTLGTGATISSLLGIGEPALFGVILRYNVKPFILMCLVSGLGGMASMLVGLKATANGVSTIPGLILYIYEPRQLIFYILIAVMTFALAFVLTWFFAVPKDVLLED